MKNERMNRKFLLYYSIDKKKARQKFENISDVYMGNYHRLYI